jgi:hypothetical protein
MILEQNDDLQMIFSIAISSYQKGNEVVYLNEKINYKK